jgi:hypothetical protein
LSGPAIEHPGPLSRLCVEMLLSSSIRIFWKHTKPKHVDKQEEITWQCIAPNLVGLSNNLATAD